MRKVRFSFVLAACIPVVLATACSSSGSSETSQASQAAPSSAASPANSTSGIDIAAIAAQLSEAGLTDVSSALLAAKPFSGALTDGTPFSVSQRIKDKLAAGEALNYVFSYQSTSLPLFSNQMITGYEKSLPISQKIVTVDGKALAPSAQADVEAQSAQILALLNTNQIDCLSLQQPDQNAMNPVRDKALEAGIPVFMVNVPGNEHEVGSFKQDSHTEGVIAAETVIAWAEANGTEPTLVGLTTGDPKASYSMGRLTGFVEALTAKYPNISFVSTPAEALNVSYDEATSYDAYKAFLTGHPDVDFIVNADLTTEHAARAIEDLGRTGKVHTIGWNLSGGQLDAIENGTQVATLDQRWVEHGGFGAIACAMLLSKDLLMPNTQKPGVVTKENVADARTLLSEALGGS